MNKCCYSCEKKCFSPATCRKCLTYKHNMDFSLHPHLLTNWIDPNNYCQSCRISASSRAFHIHSNRIHRVDSQGRMNPPIYELPYLKKNLLFIVQFATFSQKSKAVYWKHCPVIHYMKPQSIYRGPNANSDIFLNPTDVDSHWRMCDKYFVSDKRHQVHIRDVSIKKRSSLHTIQILKRINFWARYFFVPKSNCKIKNMNTYPRFNS